MARACFAIGRTIDEAHASINIAVDTTSSCRSTDTVFVDGVGHTAIADVTVRSDTLVDGDENTRVAMLLDIRIVSSPRPWKIKPNATSSPVNNLLYSAVSCSSIPVGVGTARTGMVIFR